MLPFLAAAGPAIATGAKAAAPFVGKALSAVGSQVGGGLLGKLLGGNSNGGAINIAPTQSMPIQQAQMIPTQNNLYSRLMG